MNLSHDAKWLAAGGRQGNVEIWDTSQWRRRKLIDGDGEAIESLAFISGSEPALIVTAAKRTFVAGLPPGVPLPVPMDLFENAQQIVFSPEGRHAAVQIRGQPAFGEVWDVLSRKVLPVAEGGYHCVAFSADGRQFVAGSHDGVIRIWQTADWGEPALLVGNSTPVRGIAISPDGRTVASAAEDGSIRLWSATTGRELLTFEVRLYSAWWLRFSRDGRALAASGAGGRNYSAPQMVVWQAGSAK
jgi:WD40 repeat protein